MKKVFLIQQTILFLIAQKAAAHILCVCLFTPDMILAALNTHSEERAPHVLLTHNKTKFQKTFWIDEQNSNFDNQSTPFLWSCQFR